MGLFFSSRDYPADEAVNAADYYESVSEVEPPAEFEQPAVLTQPQTILETPSPRLITDIIAPWEVLPALDQTPAQSRETTERLPQVELLDNRNTGRLMDIAGPIYSV